MKRLLEQLNSTPGVMGSMVMTDDGIPVVSLLGDEMNEECVAAFSSTVRLAANRNAEQLDNQHPYELVIEAELGNLLLIHLDGSLLAVMTHAGLELNTGLLEIRSLARRLREILTIRTP
ncbi:MAG: roadblock/LC7 domain-containing protein [Planctomycetota bacterium]|nr:roadblock/LC7 domain-containing protein [Planctomycetota bacterium]